MQFTLKLNIYCCIEFIYSSKHNTLCILLVITTMYLNLIEKFNAYHLKNCT